MASKKTVGTGEGEGWNRLTQRTKSTYREQLIDTFQSGGVSNDNSTTLSDLDLSDHTQGKERQRSMLVYTLANNSGNLFNSFFLSPTPGRRQSCVTLGVSFVRQLLHTKVVGAFFYVLDPPTS